MPVGRSDLTHAWGCSTTVALCHDNRGTAGSSGWSEVDEGVAWVRRSPALAAVHIQLLLVVTGADPARLAALAAQCQHRASAATRWTGGVEMALRRWGPPGRGRWTFALHALRSASRRDTAARWAIAHTLAEAAALALRDAGAGTDPSARARLLAEAVRGVNGADWAALCAPPAE